MISNASVINDLVKHTQIVWNVSERWMKWLTVWDERPKTGRSSCGWLVLPSIVRPQGPTDALSYHDLQWLPDVG